MDNDLSRRTIENIGYNSIAKIVTFSLRVVASVILAQRLSADDYGVVGFALVIIGFLSQFYDMGIGSAVVQKSNINQNILYTGFTIRIILGIIICLTCFVLSTKAELILDHPDTDIVIQVFAVSFVIASFSFLPDSVLRRSLEYRKISFANMIAAVVRSVISIVLALAGFKYWSIIFAEMGALIIQTICMNCYCPIRPKFVFDRAIATELVSFGGKLFLSGLVVFILFNADNFVIGAVAGSALLGFYAVAFNWGSMLSAILNDAVHSALFPTFAKIQKDKEIVRVTYLKVIEYVSMIGILVNINLLVCSKEMLYFILGRGTDKWMPAVLPLEILCIYGIIRILIEPIGNVIISFGKPEVLLKANLIAGVLEIALIYPVITLYGIIGVAILITIAYATQCVVYIPFLRNTCRVETSDLAHIIITPAFCGLISASSTLILGRAIDFSMTSMIIKLIFCTTVYVIIFGIFTKWKIMKEMKEILISGIMVKGRSIS